LFTIFSLKKIKKIISVFKKLNWKYILTFNLILFGGNIYIPTIRLWVMDGFVDTLILMSKLYKYITNFFLAFFQYLTHFDFYTANGHNNSCYLTFNKNFKYNCILWIYVDSFYMFWGKIVLFFNIFCFLIICFTNF